MEKKLKWGKMLLSLCVMMSILLAACSTNNQSADQQPEDEQTDSGLEPYEMVMLFPINNEPKDLEAVQAEINKITQEKINTTVEIIPINYGAWAQQTTLMLSSNEKVDLISSSVRGSYNQMVAQGHYLPLDDLISQYGQGAKSVIDGQNPAFLEATRVNGEIYSVPNIKDNASDFGITMRKDLVEKYNIDLNTIKSLDDLDPVFQTIKDNEPNVVPVIKYAQSILDSYYQYSFDRLGDTLGVLMYDSNDLTVVNWYETPEYASMLDTVRRWYLAGYIAKDEATDTNNRYSRVQAGRAFSWLSHMKPGIEQQESRSAGTEMVSVHIEPAVTDTAKITGSGWSIARTSQNPERVMMFIDLMFTDKDLHNLLAWGIEGQHYVKTSDGHIDFPEGVDAATSGYNLQQGYMFGNQFNSHIWTGDDLNLWEQMSEFNKGTKPSKALGFSFNAEPVKTEIASVTNVVNQFRVALETGTVDPATQLPEFIKQMKAAGMDAIIAEKQKQLDEWAANQ